MEKTTKISTRIRVYRIVHESSFYFQMGNFSHPRNILT